MTRFEISVDNSYYRDMKKDVGVAVEQFVKEVDRLVKRSLPELRTMTKEYSRQAAKGWKRDETTVDKARFKFTLVNDHNMMSIVDYGCASRTITPNDAKVFKFKFKGAREFSFFPYITLKERKPHFVTDRFVKRLDEDIERLAKAFKVEFKKR